MDTALAISLITLLLLIFGTVAALCFNFVKFKDAINEKLEKFETNLVSLDAKLNKTDKDFINEVNDLKLNINNMREDITEKFTEQIKHVHARIDGCRDDFQKEIKIIENALYERINVNHDIHQKALRDAENSLNEKMVSTKMCNVQHNNLLRSIDELKKIIEKLIESGLKHG